MSTMRERIVYLECADSDEYREPIAFQHDMRDEDLVLVLPWSCRYGLTLTRKDAHEIAGILLVFALDGTLPVEPRGGQKSKWEPK